ncbi:hypothetical protein [Paenibacillus sp. L3-i20]|uniref:hypothetical protein n=1 Tax=Paenibacillus sp. L3-i20 TaxID=2905833 RepID=UPI001EDEC018|nr:hypothetical protein [Paenibacillus sp. L3-i20]GKU76720.1 hypothetical protein L3i20_v211170 [Paenibacillus sp. L3-i20]
MHIKQKVLILIPVIFLIMLILWQTGLINLNMYGISHIAQDSKKFTDTLGHKIDGNYSVLIDLSDLKSNVGKEIYNDGSHKIVVAWIDNTGNVRSGGYRIGFRSIGRYSSNEASLVSGARHESLGDQSFTTYMSAKMTAEYENREYISSIFSSGALTYKDGDEFGFYIFPTEFYEGEGNTLDEKGIVKLMLKGLYKNIWSRS